MKRPELSACDLNALLFAAEFLTRLGGREAEANALRRVSGWIAWASDEILAERQRTRAAEKERDEALSMARRASGSHA